MSLNPAFSVAPYAKFSLNINAFNGNTTNFNCCSAPKPKPKSFATMPTTFPIQPNHDPSRYSASLSPTMIRPM